MPRVPPRDWKRMLAAYDDERFRIHVDDCDSERHLRAAAAYEAERDFETRPDRIAYLNTRKATIES